MEITIGPMDNFVFVIFNTAFSGFLLFPYMKHSPSKLGFFLASLYLN